MTPDSARVKKHRENQKKKGLVHVHVWVPKGCEDAIRSLAQEIRDDVCGKMPVVRYDPNDTKPVAVKGPA